MIDLHTHTLFSDGALLPSELVRRAAVAGLKAIALTDHVDESNIEAVLEGITGFCRNFGGDGIRVVPGVELTHVPPAAIPGLVEKARALGALIVVGHGETLSEPVAQGTNRAYIEAGVDILAHPGLITPEECRLAAQRSVFLEITARAGHCLSNGHVAKLAKAHGASLVVNSDAHGPGDLISDKRALGVVKGAGLDEDDFKRMMDNAEGIVKRVL